MVIAVAVCAAAPAENPDPWRPLVTLDFETILADATDESEPVDEEVRLVRALALLNRQPRTAASLERARGELAALERGATDPQVRAVAAYNSVRLDHVFVRTPDHAVVADRYRAVADRFPDHVFGELALAKAMTLDLTHGRAGRDVLELAKDWHPRIAGLQRESIRRGGLVILATALIEHGRAPAVAAAWLQEADYENYLRWDFRWRAHLRDIYLCLKAGQRERAQELVRSFAERYPRSPRVELLQDLASGRLAVP